MGRTFAGRCPNPARFEAGNESLKCDIYTEASEPDSDNVTNRLVPFWTYPAEFLELNVNQDGNDGLSQFVRVDDFFVDLMMPVHG